MTLSADQAASHADAFIRMLDATFPSYGDGASLPDPLRDAVAATPRHRFVHRFRIGNGPVRDSDAAPIEALPDIYSDAVMRHVDPGGALLPSSNSQPSYILHLLHLLDLAPGQAVLEIGSGSGWLAAIMARLVGPAGRVTGIELIPGLAAQSSADLEAQGLSNVRIVTGDGASGHAPGAPYDRAIITAAAWDVPAILLDQVAEGGRILVPIERRGGDGCDVTLLRRRGAAFKAERSVRGWFVPLQGATQGGRDETLISPPAGPATRHTLPLGAAAAIFRTFLSRTEPGFVRIAPASEGWRPGLPPAGSEVPAPFGLRHPEGSIALWQAGALVGYGGPAASIRLAHAYQRWAALGLPGPDAFQLAIHKTEAALDADAFTEPRGETTLSWRLDPAAATWQNLLTSATNP